MCTNNLPPGYNENRLVLMMQSPNVLYAYWDLSSGQREALANRGKLLLRLNAKNIGLRRVYEIKPQCDSFYFTDVDAGQEYFCDICIVDRDFEESYPIIYSNNIHTPEGTVKRKDTAGSPGFWGTGEGAYARGKWNSVSSEIFHK